MPFERLTGNRGNLIQCYLEGESLTSIKAKFGLSVIEIKQILIDSGTKLRSFREQQIISGVRLRRWRPKADIVGRYMAGESTGDIARSEGCGVKTVVDFLKRSGVRIRNGSEQHRAWYARHTTAERSV